MFLCRGMDYLSKLVALNFLGESLLVKSSPTQEEILSGIDRKHSILLTGLAVKDGVNSQL